MEGSLTDLGLTPSGPAPLRSTFTPNPLESTIPTQPSANKSATAKAEGDAAEAAGPSSGAIVPANAAAEAAEEQVDRVKHPSGIVPVLQNVVATVTLGVKLDLKQIALKARNAEFNPKRFAAVIMRIRDPKTTALIFASGKMVCTGAKSEEKSRLAARKYCRILQKLDYNAQFQEFKIQNIVGSCDVKFPIFLEGLAWAHDKFASYEPELFPGLIYRMIQPKIVLLIFVSGKVVLTGAKHRDEIYLAFEQLYPVLQEFKPRGPQAGLPKADGEEEEEEGDDGKGKRPALDAAA